MVNSLVNDKCQQRSIKITCFQGKKTENVLKLLFEATMEEIKKEEGWENPMDCDGELK